MTRMKRRLSTEVRFAVPTAILIITLTGLIGVFESQYSASAARADLGILGRQAPELNLSDWIDEDGKKTDPIRLNDFEGKVVYLYFFQDW